MSLFNYPNQNRRKKNFFPKIPIRNDKSFENSSKSTRATNKNILLHNNPNDQKLYEKTDYFDLYSDLISTRQTEKNIIKKRNPKEEDEESNNSLLSLEKEAFKKIKKPYVQKNVEIKFIKYYKEDGEKVKFPLFNERDIKIDEYDNQVKIESAEDDFESDESTMDYGKKRVDNDLLEAFTFIKKEKENINCLINYQRYGKYIKRPKKKLDLIKNLPFIPPIEKNKASSISESK
jgi:hypothetical protein